MGSDRYDKCLYLGDELRQLLSEIEEIEANYHAELTAYNDLEELQSQWEEFETAIAHAGAANYDEMIARATKIEGQLQTLVEEMNTLNDQLAALNEEIEYLEEQIGMVDKPDVLNHIEQLRTESKNVEAEELEQEHTEAMDKYNDHKKRYDQACLEYEGLDSLLADKSTEYEKLSAELDIMEEALASLPEKTREEICVELNELYEEFYGKYELKKNAYDLLVEEWNRHACDDFVDSGEIVDPSNYEYTEPETR